MGKVFVFNIFSEEMTIFSVNGAIAGSIPEWARGGESMPPYTPASLAVDRALNPTIGLFSNGKNSIILQWPSNIFWFDLAIDGNRFPLSENLVLTIMFAQWQFHSSSGVIVDQGKLNPGTAFMLSLLRN